MKTYRTFVFKNYHFDEPNKTLDLNYSIDDKLHFTESYHFDFDFALKRNKELEERAMTSLFYMAGVSYFKTFLPPNIKTNPDHPLDNQMARFFSKTWQKGLGEFFYVNKVDPNTTINFEATTEDLKQTDESHSSNGLLVAIGGGKDSLVSIELLMGQNIKMASWSVGHEAQLKPLVDKIGLPHYFVNRIWDRQLLSLNKSGAHNGHVPISAILSCVGLVVAALSGQRDIVVSNEQSANESTLKYQGAEINHQYSKSQEYERDFQAYLKHIVGDQIRYYSLLRPLSEVRIAELFAEIGFEKYKDVFSSCNRAFVHSSSEMSWCGECPKCAFVFLALTPFVERRELEAIWSGHNLLLDERLEPIYRNLLGIEGEKPLECVGEVKEVRSAMQLAFKHYPELKSKYKFELPTDYDYAEVKSDEMPGEIRDIVLKAISIHPSNF